MELSHEELETLVDQMTDFYDQLAFNAMNKIIEQIRGETK